MSIFITGDIHADFTRFNKDLFPEQKELNKNDFMIICGDFGGVWDGSLREKFWLDWLNEKPFTTLFVTGNHENYEMISTYPIDKWNGGQVQFIRPSVIHLMRGQVYDIEGKKFFTMGGASSHDIEDGILEPDDPKFRQKRYALDARGAYYRINHVTWWKEELPNAAEYQTARANLEKAGWNVDYIITHCCPSSIQDILSDGLYQRDALTDFFDEISKKCQFDYWFFGHYHDNRTVAGKFILLYEQIIELELSNS